MNNTIKSIEQDGVKVTMEQSLGLLGDSYVVRSSRDGITVGEYCTENFEQASEHFDSLIGIVEGCKCGDTH